MKFDSWKNTAELVGLAAIVASLVFVGLELRQSHEIAIGAQYQERVALAVETTFEYKRDEVYRSRQIDGFRGRISYADIDESNKQQIAELADDELVTLYFFGLAQLNIFDNHLFQYQSGLLTEESWAPQRERLKFIIRNNVVAKYMVVLAPDIWRSSFVNLVRNIIEEIDTEAKSQ